MKDIVTKVVSVLILAAFAYVVYLETGARFSSDAGSTASKSIVPLSDAEQLYSDLGGKSGTTPVIVFVTSWCSVCTALEKQLKRSGVTFVRTDVEKNRASALMYQVLMRGRSNAVPITLVGTEVFVGFQPRKIIQAVKTFGSGSAVLAFHEITTSLRSS